MFTSSLHHPHSKCSLRSVIHKNQLSAFGSLKQLYSFWPGVSAYFTFIIYMYMTPWSSAGTCVHLYVSVRMNVSSAWRSACRSAARGRCGRSWWPVTGEGSTWWATSKLPSSTRDWHTSPLKTWYTRCRMHENTPNFAVYPKVLYYKVQGQCSWWQCGTRRSYSWESKDIHRWNGKVPTTTWDTLCATLTFYLELCAEKTNKY